MLQTDICIAGAGIIGLSLALELEARGVSVIVVEAGAPLREASFAAAGMLAAHDPHNPAELTALAELSVDLYPGFLDRMVQRSGMAVPLQTFRTLQCLPSAPEGAAFSGQVLRDVAEYGVAPEHFRILDENSVDPRQLASSLYAATVNSSVRLMANCPVTSTSSQAGSVLINTEHEVIQSSEFVDCTGAWASDPAFRVTPIKGQMLAVALPADFPLAITVRSRNIYIVPRMAGPNAGRAVIGATVEEAGFDKQVHPSQIKDLQRQAISLLPQLANAAVVESWCGLRPATPDRLPLLGAHPMRPNHWVAAGHYRNGILLAPATAHVMAQLLLGESSPVSLLPFLPSRTFGM